MKKRKRLDWMRACMHASALSCCVRWCQVERTARGEVLCIQTAITCHDLNFKFWRRRDRLHVLRLWSPCSMHCSHVNYTPQ